MIVTLPQIQRASPYVGYTYGYPHKSAYRPIDPALPLDEIWRPDERAALFLYIHMPFCEMRCGFCNLFTMTHPGEELVDAYLRALGRQAAAVRSALGDATYVRLAIGGGTPTFLDESRLAQVLSLATDVLEVNLPRVPSSVEVSPATTTAGRLRVLRDAGVDRVSIGIQTFNEGEARALGRHQSTTTAHTALELISAANFPVLNIDLIYGAEGQSTSSWLDSVNTALSYKPQEIYLYPLYVRPLTGLGKLGHEWDDQRLEAYRAGRELLLSRSYRQVSMRMFRSADAPEHDGPVYCCQSDGMVGLGCGARSYTRCLHYSDRYAVERGAVRQIIRRYAARTIADFELVDYGFRLDDEDQRRRYAILSLLQSEGLFRPEYRQRFGADVLDHLPQLLELAENGLALIGPDRVVLTDCGLERSDAIGPWLNSQRVRRLMEDFECR